MTIIKSDRRALTVARSLAASTGVFALGALVAGCAGGPAQEGDEAPSSESASVTPDSIASLALANKGKGACSKNSRGGHDFDSSCTGNGGQPEYWCADFARWVWASAGVQHTGELTAAAGSFYVYGQNHGTLKSHPEVGDAVVFDYHGGGSADHVAIVSTVNANGTIETVSGDWNGVSGSEAEFSSTSHVVVNTPAYRGKVGDQPGVIGMTISGFVRPVGLQAAKPTPIPPKPTACGKIEPGHGLAAGEALKSCDGRFELSMESNGSLVWSGPPGVMWSTSTKGKGGHVAVMQGDGNFVLYDASSGALWSSDTWKHAGAMLALQDDGDLVVYDTHQKVLWASHTQLPAAPPAPSGCDQVKPGEGLTMGGDFSACGGAFTLSMQHDGNLVLYQNSPHKAVWATGTNGRGGFNAIMQADGNFVLYDVHDKAIWASDTQKHPGAYLGVQSEGNLVVYETVACQPGPECEVALWASNAAKK